MVNLETCQSGLMCLFAKEVIGLSRSGGSNPPVSAMNSIEYKINDLSDPDSVIEISKNIFSPSWTEADKYHKKEDWIEKINSGGLLVVTYIDNKLVGFAMCYVKNKDTLHIWLGGVLEKYRGLGLWTGAYNKIEEYAKIKKYRRLTLNTYKDKYSTMYAFATKHGFSCYKTEITDKLEKSFFEKWLND